MREARSFSAERVESPRNSAARRNPMELSLRRGFASSLRPFSGERVGGWGARKHRKPMARHRVFVGVAAISSCRLSTHHSTSTNGGQLVCNAHPASPHDGRAHPRPPCYLVVESSTRRRRSSVDACSPLSVPAPTL